MCCVYISFDTIGGVSYLRSVFTFTQEAKQEMLGYHYDKACFNCTAVTYLHVFVIEFCIVRIITCTCITCYGVCVFCVVSYHPQRNHQSYWNVSFFWKNIIRQTLTWVVICTTKISTVQAGRTPSSQLQFLKRFSLFKHLLCCTRPKLNLGEAFLVKLSLKLSSDSKVSMQPTFSRFEPQPDS